MTAPNPSVALATVVVDELVRNGLTDACLAPGSRSTALAMALHDHPAVRLHVGIDERSVAYLATGIARATRRPVAAVSTSGTAAVNFHPAVVEADRSRVPLLLLTANRPPEARDVGSNQTIDQVGIFASSARRTLAIAAAEDRPDAPVHWRSTCCQAWAAAAGVGGPPGPVQLDLGFREPTVPASDDGRTRAAPFAHDTGGRPGGAPWTASAALPAPPRETDVARLAAAVTAAERGIIVVGDTDAAPAPLLAFADRAGWPVLAEPLSGARSGPDAISTYGSLLAHAPFAATHRPDLALRVGRAVLSRALGSWLTADVPQVLIDPHGWWSDPGRAASELVVAEPAALLAAVAERLPDRGPSPWRASWRDAEARARAAIDGVLDEQAEASEPRTARDLAAAADPGTVLVVASSMPVRDLDRFMAPRTGLRVTGNRGASGIDGFVSTALGVALGHPGPTVALAGDLSVLHDQGGFLLLGERPDLVLVVVNNDGGGIFSFLPPAGYPAFERLFGTPHGRDLGLLAGLHGWAHDRVDAAADLVPAVRRAQAAGGTHLVEVRTDRQANVALHERLQRAVAAALSR